MKLSIILPTYNRASFIERAIKSVLNQSFTDFEIIVVDDGSKDDTENIVLNFKDKRIVYKKFSQNKGANFARNRGIQLAKGEWIGYLDSDDKYTDDAFQTVVGILNNEGKEMDVVAFMTVRDDGNVSGYIDNKKWDSFYPSYEDIVLKKQIGGDMNHFIKRAVFDEKFKYPEFVNGLEMLLNLRLIKYGKKFMYVNKVIYEVFRDSNASLSLESYHKWPRQFARGYKELVKEHFGILSKHPDRLIHYYLRIAKCYFKIFDLRGLWWMIKAFMLKPNKVFSLLKNKINI